MKTKRLLSYLLSVCLIFALCTNGTFAMEVVPQSASSEAVVTSTIADAPSGVSDFLDTCGVAYNSDSVIQVLEKTGNARSANEGQTLRVKTAVGDRTDDTILMGFDPEGDSAPVNFEALFVEPRAGKVREFPFQGTMVRVTTSFNVTVIGNKRYVRPIGQYFHCRSYDNGVIPSQLKVQTAICGDLYSSDYNFIKHEYVYTNSQTVYAPPFGTVYSQNKVLPANRAIVPDPYGNVGFEINVDFTYNGYTARDTQKVYY